jgi:simple sugar transport system permease protein
VAARTPLLAVLLGLAVLTAGLQLAGYDAPTALAALWQGAAGSWYAFTSATLVRAIPLILIGLAIALAFRGGALNIGAEGQFYAGAVAATWVGLHAAGRAPVVAVAAVLLAAMLAGLAWVAVPVWLKLRFGVLEVISTLLLNFVAESFVSLMVQGPLQESQHIYPQSDPIAEAARAAPAGTRLAGLAWLPRPCALVSLRGRSSSPGRWAVPRAAEISGRIDARRMTAVALLVQGRWRGWRVG